MSKLKKMPKQFGNDVTRLEDLFDKYEQMGHSIIRVRERNRTEIAPEKAEITCIRGFEVFGKSDAGWGLSCGQTYLYPATDGFRYGYVPNTEHNLSKLKNLLSSRNLVLEDKEFIDYAIEDAKKNGLPTEYTQRTNDVGMLLDKDEIRKRNKIAELEKQLAQQELDARIAELEAKLNPTVTAIVAEEKQEDVVEQTVDVAEQKVQIAKPTVARSGARR